MNTAQREYLSNIGVTAYQQHSNGSVSWSYNQAFNGGSIATLTADYRFSVVSVEDVPVCGRAATVARRLTYPQLVAARAWVSDCEWAECGFEECDYTDREIERGVARHYDGGLDGFLGDL